MSDDGEDDGKAGERSWRAPEEDAGERLDRHVARRLDVPRNRVQRWIAEGRVEIDGETAGKVSTALRGGERLRVAVPEPAGDPRIVPEPGELAVLYEDEDLVVLDKAAGLAVHPGAGRASGPLVHCLLHRYPEIVGTGGPGRPGIVHRLDLDTTGVMVVARHDRAYQRLSAAFAAREVDKTYIAIVYGTPREERGRIDEPMTVLPRGRPAATRWQCRRGTAGISWLVLDIETGRTHQIRVHLKALGHPLIGDPVYGEARWRGLEPRLRTALRDFPRPALHAWRLAFRHPASGEKMRFEAPLPADMVELWRRVTGEEPPARS